MRRLWQRWKFHLNAAVLLVPLALVPDQFPAAPPNTAAPAPAREWSVGPWQAAVSDVAAASAADGAAGRAPRRFAVSFRDGYPDRIRAAYLRFGKPRDGKAAGVLLKGNPFRLQAQLPAPERADEELWLTVEGWDGSVHQVPLAVEAGERAGPEATAAGINTEG